MVRRRTMLYLLSAVMLVLVVVFCVIEAQTKQNPPITFTVENAVRAEQIRLWTAGDGKSFVFVPGYAEMSQIKIRLQTSDVVSINGIALVDGMDCSSFLPEEAYTVSYRVWGREHQQSVTFLRSQNVATVFIETASETMDYIHQKKGNKESGTIAVYAASGNVEYAGDLESIQGRGFSSWGKTDKKPYSISLAESADLLGMGKAKNWILLSNVNDLTNLRNKTVYEFAEQMGLPYSPDCDWADVYLNGQYAGLYLLSERNEVHEQRVAIGTENSFLVSMELESRLIQDGRTYITTKADRSLRIRYPLVDGQSDLSAIQRTIQSAENAILAEDGIDPDTGKSWTDLIDLDSWANKFLIEELFGNIDASAISQYFYVDGNDPSGKIYAGPVWDYDLSMGNEVEWSAVLPWTLFANRQETTPWTSALCEKDLFYERVRELYQQKYLPALEKLLNENIPVYEAHIAQSAKLNQIRWLTGEQGASAEKIVQYMQERIALLDKLWIEKTPYQVVVADQGFGANPAYYFAFDGQPLKGLYAFEDTENSRFAGWYDKETDQPFDLQQPITRDMQIYAKWEDTDTNKTDDLLKLLPLGVLALMGGALLWVEWKRNRKSR